MVTLSKAKAFFLIAINALKDKGVSFFFARLADYVSSFLVWQYYKRYTPSHTFTLRSESYKYFYNLYNITWKNERAVEIPIAWREVEKNKDKKILEVGNVLSWYFPIQHDVLDKYEVAAGVINKDIIDFTSSEKYDLIVSVSTLEHIGWDETPREPQKVFSAVEHLKTLLASGGKLLVTFPLGYNPALDGFAKDGSLGFTRQLFLKRVSKDPKWIEIDPDAAFAETRNQPYRVAHMLMIGVYEK